MSYLTNSTTDVNPAHRFIPNSAVRSDVRRGQLTDELRELGFNRDACGFHVLSVDELSSILAAARACIAMDDFPLATNDDWMMCPSIRDLDCEEP